MKLHGITFALVIIGGLNWGLVGVAHLMDANNNWNVVNLLLGQWPVVENIVYLIVGLSALVLMFGHKKDCRACNPSGAM